MHMRCALVSDFVVRLAWKDVVMPSVNIARTGFKVSKKFGKSPFYSSFFTPICHLSVLIRYLRYDFVVTVLKAQFVYHC